MLGVVLPNAGEELERGGVLRLRYRDRRFNERCLELRGMYVCILEVGGKKISRTLQANLWGGAYLTTFCILLAFAFLYPYVKNGIFPSWDL